jgi:hypothetical protein
MENPDSVMEDLDSVMEDPIPAESSDETTAFADLRGRLSEEQSAELSIFQNQNWLELERERRQRDFENEILLLRLKFRQEEAEILNETLVRFGHRILV